MHFRKFFKEFLRKDPLSVILRVHLQILLSSAKNISRSSVKISFRCFERMSSENSARFLWNSSGSQPMSIFGGFVKSFSGSSFRCSYILQVHLVVSTEVPTEVAPESFFRSSSKVSCVFFRVLHLKKFSG